MGLTSFFDRIFRVRRIVDPVFGSLLYQKAGRYWEGEVLFAPTGGTVDGYVDGDEEGPTESQRDFFRRLVDRYPSLYTAILAHAERGHPSPAGMTLAAIDLPDDAARGDCELTYESPDGARHVTVVISGWAPVDVYAVEDG